MKKEKGSRKKCQGTLKKEEKGLPRRCQSRPFRGVVVTFIQQWRGFIQKQVDGALPY